MIGKTIGQYHVLDNLGGGGMGVVYEAEDTRRLARYIELLFRDAARRKDMAEAALRTAKSWPPKRGVQIILENTI